MFKDPQIEVLIQKELVRQTEGIELIASENYASEFLILDAINDQLDNVVIIQPESITKNGYIIC